MSARPQLAFATAEGLVLHLTPARRMTRLGALVIDLVLVGAIIALVAVALGLTGVGLYSRQGLSGAVQAVYALWIAASFALRNFWFALWEMGPRGATPGKRLMRLRVAGRPMGGVATRLSAERIIARNLLRDVELAVPVMLLGMDLGLEGAARWLVPLGWLAVFGALPLWNREGLRCGDIIGGTVVVEAPRAGLAAMLAAPAPAALAPAAFTPAELAVYGEYELQTLEGVLRDGDGPHMAQVAATIAHKIGRPAPDDAAGFLGAYYAALRQQLEGGRRLGRRKADKHTAEQEA